jgi:HD-like signal output (HDOD) protein
MQRQSDMKIEALFQQPNALPSAPKVVQDLISSFNNELISMDNIANKLATDPVLSAKLLRLANSAYYHVSRSVSTVNDAVMMLGFVTVRTLVISSGLVNGFKSAAGLDLKQFWRYSLNTAVVAKWLAQQTNENSELVFTVGMMHAIGQLVIHAGKPVEAKLLDKEVNPLDTRRFAAERNSFGYDFAEVGAELAVRWKFPNAYSEIIRAFPRPLDQQPFNTKAAIIYLAAWFARANENHLTKEEIRANFPAEIGAKLGIEYDLLLDKMPSISELSCGLEELVA